MIFKPGENCWRVERAHRVAFLIDGAAYFSALRRAMARARRSILMVGWDFDTSVPLSPESSPADGWPRTLLPFLNEACARTPGLSVHIVAWDFSMIYAFEREPLPAMQFAKRAHRRVHFTLDGEHPVGASHHQKIVVIDDEVAFSGGLDLTFARWDTPAHEAHDARRLDADGHITRPMHDVQVAVEGPAAAALGDLVRARWKAATGDPLPASRAETTGASSVWPQALAADVEDADLAIARTASDQGRSIIEIEAMTLEAIALARRAIYIENQYLTSSSVGRAIAARLEEPDGPEVVLVLPKDQGGWLEQSSMGVLRSRLLAYLRSRDGHGRLRAYFPVVPGLSSDQCLGVHSKVLIVDDAFAKVGSANLSNRSMGLDSECDLALSDSVTPGAKQAIAGLRARLLSEHLGIEPSAFDARMTDGASLIASVESFNHGPRRLETLEAGPDPALHLAVLDGLVCDPERPVAPERLIEQFVPPTARRMTSRSLLGYAALLMLVLVVGAAWRFTPLGELLAVERVVATGQWIRRSPAGPLYVAAAYLVGGLLFFPITLLVTATTLVFDPLEGFVYSMLGTLGSACLTYGAGRVVGRPVVEQLLTSRLRVYRAELRRRSFATILGARLVPVGNFSLINLLAGALQVRFRAYFFANVVGILPGILGFTLFADRLGHTLANPRFGNLVALALWLAVIVGALWLVRRGLERARRTALPAPSSKSADAIG